METKDRTALKSYFVKNAIPTESNFADLIDGMLNQREDGLEKRAGEPVRVQADSGPMQKILSFYKNFAESKPAWTLSLNPRADVTKPDTARPGWSVGDGDGTSRLFIDESTGNIGVGTVDPGEAKLAVAGGFQATSNVSGERALGMEVPRNANHRGDGEQTATGLVYRVLRNPAAGEPIFQVTSQGHAVRFFVEHDGWTGSRDNSAWFGGGKSNYFKGRVGIGTMSPSAILELSAGTANVSAKVNDTSLLFTRGSDGSDVAGLVFDGKSKLTVRSLGGGGRIVFEDNHDGKNLEAMRIQDGKVGIGTKPQEALDVNGNIKMAGGHTFSCPGRMHVTGDEHFYLLHKKGVVIGKEWGGDGSLQVQGTAKVSVLQLGEKWRLSSIGDAHANDGWLRFFNVGNTGYYGGVAAGKLYTAEGHLAGSDARNKKDVSSLERALDKVLALRGVRFRWRNADDDAPFTIGLVAQEVEEVFPEVVGVGPEGRKGIDYAALVAPLIEAVKHQQTQIDALRAALGQAG